MDTIFYVCDVQRRRLFLTFYAMPSIYDMVVSQDLRYAVRTLRLSPGFTLVAVASLALGIGANMAIFRIIDAALLRTLPVRNPQELAEVCIAEIMDFGSTRNAGN